jgi:hypothetical protein
MDNIGSHNPQRQDTEKSEEFNFKTKIRIIWEVSIKYFKT